MSQSGGFLRDEIRSRALSRALNAFGLAAGCFAIGAFGVVLFQTGAVAAAAVIVMLMGVYLVVKGVRTLRERNHPERYGSFGPLLDHFQVSLDELSLLVEEERAALPANARGTLVVLPSWIWDPRGPLLVPLHEIAWVYPKRTTEYVNGRIESERYELIIRPLYAPERELSISTNPGAAEAIVGAVTRQAPWTLVGYDQERRMKMLSRDGCKEITDAVRARRDQLRAS